MNIVLPNRLFHSRQLYNWIIEQQVPPHIIQQSQEQLQILRKRFDNSIEQYNQMNLLEQIPQGIELEEQKLLRKVVIGDKIEKLGVCIHHCSGVSFGYSWVVWEKIFDLSEEISILIFSLTREILSRIGLISLISPISSKRLFWMEFEICHLILDQILPFISVKNDTISSIDIDDNKLDTIVEQLNWIQTCPLKQIKSSDEEYLQSIIEWYTSHPSEGTPPSQNDVLDQLGFWEQNDEVWVCWSSYVGNVFGDVAGHIVRECVWDILQRHQKAANKRIRWDQIKKIDIIYSSIYPPNHPLQEAEIQLLKKDIAELILFHQPEYRQKTNDESLRKVIKGNQSNDSHSKSPKLNKEEANHHLMNCIVITPQNHPRTWLNMLRSYPKAFRTTQYEDLPILQGSKRLQGMLSKARFRKKSEQYHNRFEMGRDLVRDFIDGLQTRYDCKTLLLLPNKTQMHIAEATLCLPTEVQLYTTRGGRWPSSKISIGQTS